MPAYSDNCIPSFLQTYVEPAHAIAGRAHVFPPSQFGDAGDDEGNDVFLCEFEYDEAWKRFRRRRYTGSRDTTGQEIMPTTPGGPGYSDGAVAMAGGQGGCLWRLTAVHGV